VSYLSHDEGVYRKQQTVRETMSEYTKGVRNRDKGLGQCTKINRIQCTPDDSDWNPRPLNGQPASASARNDVSLSLSRKRADRKAAFAVEHLIFELELPALISPPLQ
jgi:hypothetical protein